MGDGSTRKMATLRAIQIDWDGTHMPEELRQLPPGTYLVQFVDDIHELTPEEDAGLREALDDLEAGHFVSYEDAMRELRAGLSSE
jgi:hypothetical protein